MEEDTLVPESEGGPFPPKGTGHAPVEPVVVEEIREPSEQVEVTEETPEVEVAE